MMSGRKKAPAERGSTGAFVWDYLAKQDLARSADRSTWFLYSLAASFPAVYSSSIIPASGSFFLMPIKLLHASRAELQYRRLRSISKSACKEKQEWCFDRNSALCHAVCDYLCTDRILFRRTHDRILGS